MSTKRILKYGSKFEGGYEKFSVPIGGKFLAVQLQNEMYTFWFECDSEEQNE